MVIVISIKIIMFKRLFGKKNHRHDIVRETDIKSLCIYVSYIIDDDDIRFIENNKDYCDMVVIESINAPSLTNMRIKSMKGITYRSRPNIGYDATAWKEYVLDNIDNIRSYDYVLFVNNSCRYDFLIKDTIEDMRAKGATLYGLNRSHEYTDHIQSFYIIVHKSLTNTPEFLDHWRLMKPITDRHSAIHNHELTFTKNMKKIGAIVDSLTTYKLLKNTYKPEVYHEGMGELPPFMKKKLLTNSTNRTQYLYLLKLLPHMI
jgi:lipopolysaccharide biosynthesis protein